VSGHSSSPKRHNDKGRFPCPEEVVRLDKAIAAQMRTHRGYRAIRAIDGVGPVPGAVMVAEIET